jgi:hypothetical protein
MVSAVRFDLISARIALIAREIADAGCDVEVVEFSPRAMLGPLVMRAWKENQAQQQQQQQQPAAGQMRVMHFMG